MPVGRKVPGIRSSATPAPFLPGHKIVFDRVYFMYGVKRKSSTSYTPDKKLLSVTTEKVSDSNRFSPSRATGRKLRKAVWVVVAVSGTRVWAQSSSASTVIMFDSLDLETNVRVVGTARMEWHDE